MTTGKYLFNLQEQRTLQLQFYGVWITFKSCTMMTLFQKQPPKNYTLNKCQIYIIHTLEVQMSLYTLSEVGAQAFSWV